MKPSISLPFSVGVLAQEVRRQQRDVRRALAQRRHLERDDVQPVVEVLAELAPPRPSACRLRLVAAMTRTSTLMVSLPPTRSNSCSCRKRSSLTWTAGEISPISSRNSVPPLACWKRPSRRADRAGERAALVAEQLALEQRLGERRAVQLHERALGARAALVDGGRDQLLAGARLAGDQHAGARDGATWATVLNTCCIGAELPMMLSKLYFSDEALRAACPASARSAPLLELARHAPPTARRR